MHLLGPFGAKQQRSETTGAGPVNGRVLEVFFGTNNGTYPTSRTSPRLCFSDCKFGLSSCPFKFSPTTCSGGVQLLHPNTGVHNTTSSGTSGSQPKRSMQYRPHPAGNPPRKRWVVAAARHQEPQPPIIIIIIIHDFGYPVSTLQHVQYQESQSGCRTNGGRRGPQLLHLRAHVRSTGRTGPAGPPKAGPRGLHCPGTR